MMRVIGVIIAAVVVFLAAVLVPLALKGQLNADTIKRLAGGQEKAPAAVEAEPEAAAGPLTTKIKEEQERLRAWEMKLQEREERLDQREQLLDQTLAEVTKAQDEVKLALGEADTQHTESLQGIAKTLEKMDPKKAAEVLSAMEAADGAKITPLISDRIRGQIFDEMDAKARTSLVEVLQAKKL